MKILVCTQEYYPKGSGIANVAHYVVKELEKLGHGCDVLSSNAGNIPVNFDKKIKRFAGFGLLAFWKRVRKYIEEHEDEYDLIWVHNPLFLKKVNSKKIYSTVHTTYVTYFDIYKKMKYSFGVKAYYFIMKYLERKCYRKNKFPSSTVSPEVRKEIIKLGIPRLKAKYIANGVDTKKFSPVKGKLDVKIPKGNKVIACVGRVTYQKNPFGLIEIMKKMPKVTLLWAGRGELLEKARKYVKDNKINNVQFLGNIKHEDLPKLYSGADAYILASLYEGQPLTLLEAMSCGAPCIVSDIPNMTQLINESGCGVIIDTKKPNIAAKKIMNYLNSTKAKRDREKVRKYSIKELDWKVITKRYLEEWEKMQ